MKPKALFVMLILWLSFTTIQARSTEDVPDKGTYAKFLLVGCYMKPDEEVSECTGLTDKLPMSTIRVG